jgi:hypothetical protein
MKMLGAKLTPYQRRQIGLFCVENKLKMNDWVEKEIEKILDKNDTDKRN